MDSNWQAKWDLVDGTIKREGGQGAVTQVRAKSDATLGALKTLHSRHLRNKERRGYLSFFIIRPNVSNPKATFQHTITYDGRQYIAAYRIEESDSTEYYRGSPSDFEFLQEAVRKQSGIILAQLIRVLAEKIQSTLSS